MNNQDKMKFSNPSENAVEDIVEKKPLEEHCCESMEEEEISGDALIKENTNLKDQVLRLAADMENLRRRTARDIEEIRSYSISSFARDLLIVADNLRRGLDLASNNEKRSKDTEFHSLMEGVELTERTLLSTLERYGVKKMMPEGEKFDPNFHQAMFEVPSVDCPANTVIQVVQAGYMIKDRVLRPAMVGVAKTLDNTHSTKHVCSDSSCDGHEDKKT